MSTPEPNLTEEQQAAVAAGTHVIDPVHGFVPRVPLSEDGEPVQDAPTANVTEDERIQAGEEQPAPTQDEAVQQAVQGQQVVQEQQDQ